MRKFLITMMCIIMVVCFMPTVAMAGTLVGEVSAITEGSPSITDITLNAIATKQVMYSNSTTLDWVAEDAEAGRGAGWYVGIKLTAPEGYVKGSAKYSNDGSTPSIPVQTKLDGENPDYIELWGEVSEASLKQCQGEGWYGYVTFLWTFDWDGNGSADQQVLMYVRANRCTLMKNGEQVYPVAKIDGKDPLGCKTYGTLREAIDEVDNNQTITLLKNVQLTDDDKDGTATKRLAIDNGKTFSIDLGGNTLAGRLNLRHGNVTIKDGNMTNDTQPLNVYGSTDSGASNYSVLTIASDVTVSAADNVVCMMPEIGNKAYGAVINIAGAVEATGTGNDAAVYVSGNIGNDEVENIAAMSSNNVINITGTVTGGNIMAVAMSGQATVNVESTAKVSGSTGIGVKRGVLNVVDGATINSDGDKVDPAVANTNGAENTGAAISVTSTYNNHGSIAVNVLGGNVKSVNNSALYVGHSKQGDASKAFEKGMTISITGGNLVGAEKAVFVSDKIASDNESYPQKFIVGGTFSSDVSACVTDGKYEYAMRNGTYIVQGAEKPAFTTGNYWSDLAGNVYTEMYSAPYIPPTTPTDNVTNSGTSGTDNATTSADLSGSTSTSNGTTSSTVDKTTADKIVDKAVENKSTEVVIDATANTTTAANSTTIAQVTIPTETLGAIAEKTEADVTIKTDVAEVKMDNAAAAAVSEQATGETVQIIAEKVAEDAEKVEFELKVVCSDGKVISDFNGGNVAVTVALPKAMADKKVVCVYIDDNGHMSKVEGQKNADGTYTFVTGHFSSYAIMAEEEADAAIAAQKEAIKNIKIKLTSKQVKTKAGKKAVKITWTADAGDKVLDGVEVFRSTERYKGYGTEPFYTSTKGGNKGSYTNTKSLKKGTKYYYRVRGYVLVDGQKVYTDYSTKAWRTV